MKLAAWQLRQHDGVTCGPTVAVVAGALMDPVYRAGLIDPGTQTVGAPGRAWFAAEQRRIHAEVNRVWPRRLGTTPMAMVRALNEHRAASGVRYRWVPFDGRRLRQIVDAVTAGWPVPLLVGGAVPRHWVLIVGIEADGALHCYEPSSGEVRPVPVSDLRRRRLTNVGYPRPFAVVLPSIETRSATT